MSAVPHRAAAERPSASRSSLPRGSCAASSRTVAALPWAPQAHTSAMPTAWVQSPGGRASSRRRTAAVCPRAARICSCSAQGCSRSSRSQCSASASPCSATRCSASSGQERWGAVCVAQLLQGRAPEPAAVRWRRERRSGGSGAARRYLESARVGETAHPSSQASVGAWQAGRSREGGRSEHNLSAERRDHSRTARSARESG